REGGRGGGGRAAPAVTRCSTQWHARCSGGCHQEVLPVTHRKLAVASALAAACILPAASVDAQPYHGHGHAHFGVFVGGYFGPYYAPFYSPFYWGPYAWGPYPYPPFAYGAYVPS